MGNRTDGTSWCCCEKRWSVEEISIGEKESDPVFVITDLLVHLAANQMSKKASEVIEGEKLDLLIGNSPLDKAEGLDEEEKETIKANVLHILKENYGIEEEDFASAELEIVPAGKARDCGFDRSMILSYGQDDRVCHLLLCSLCWMWKCKAYRMLSVSR